MSNFYFEVGTWDKYWNEVQDLAKKHFNEVKPHNMPDYEPDANLYGALGAAGINSVIWLLDIKTNEVKGYASCSVNFHPHYKNVLMAMIDAFYVCADYRAENKTAGRELIEMTETYLRDVREVKFVQIASGVNRDIGKWLGREGYEPLETIYIKRI